MRNSINTKQNKGIKEQDKAFIEQNFIEQNIEINQRNSKIRKQIEVLAETDYKAFTSRLLPGVSNILGVRLPNLRKMAKEIAGRDWRTYLDYASDESFEEIMLQGLVIGYVKQALCEVIPYIEKFVNKIDNWSVCDSFCSGLKIAKENREEMWNFLKPYFHKQGEFEVRFGVVMLLNYYLEVEYIEPVFKIFDEIEHDGYYVKMAVAWAISIYYINFPETIEEYLRNNKLDEFTYKKALQKICESRAVDTVKKAQIRELKRVSFETNVFTETVE